MTFEHGRISTWRLPRFSAFEMDLRQSARTCGEKGEGSVPVAALLMCVLHRELCGGGRPPALPGRGHVRCSGVGPPASDLEVPPASGETLGSSRQRAAVIASRASRARVVRRRRGLASWVRRGRVLSSSEAKHKMQAYGPRR